MKKLINEIIEFGNDMNRHNSAAFASSISFFFFLALFPSIMFMCSLLPYLPLNQMDIVNLFVTFVPDALADTVKEIINDIYSSSVATLPIFAFATIITAGMGMMGLIRGLNGVLDIEDNRNYFVIRAIATVYTLLLFAVLLLSMIILGMGKSLFKSIVGVFPHLHEIFTFILKFRTLFLVLIMLVVFTMIYSFLPAQRQSIKYQIPGAFIASVGWLVITWAYSVYIDYFHGFSIYGSLLGIMVILFWLYACFTLLIFGAFFNKYYKREVKRTYRILKERRKKFKIK